MPYDNELNRKIASQMREILEKHIQHNPIDYDNMGLVGYANKQYLDDENVENVRDELEEKEDGIEELKGGALGAVGGFARGTIRDTGEGERTEGAGFWKDFKKGFKKGFNAVVKPATAIMSLIPHPAAQTASKVLGTASNVVGDGKKKRGRKPKAQKVKEEVPADLLLKKKLVGGEVGVMKKKRGRPNLMKGGTDLAEPHNMIKADGTTGDGKPKRVIGGKNLAVANIKIGNASRKPIKEKIVPVANMQSSSMAGQGKSKGKTRSEVVKEVMKKRGVKMIEASKIVKAENLYKKKGE